MTIAVIVSFRDDLVVVVEQVMVDFHQIVADPYMRHHYHHSHLETTASQWEIDRLVRLNNK